MRVLITGITGFVGSHLAEYLLSMGNIEVSGIERWRSKTENIDHLKEKINFYRNSTACLFADPCFDGVTLCLAWVGSFFVDKTYETRSN